MHLSCTIFELTKVGDFYLPNLHLAPPPGECMLSDYHRVPCLVLIAQAVFHLDCGPTQIYTQTHTHTKSQTPLVTHPTYRLCWRRIMRKNSTHCSLFHPTSLRTCYPRRRRNVLEYRDLGDIRTLILRMLHSRIKTA